MALPTFRPGDRVEVLSPPVNFRRGVQTGVVAYRVPLELHYYAVRVDGRLVVANDSLMRHASR